MPTRLPMRRKERLSVQRMRIARRQKYDEAHMFLFSLATRRWMVWLSTTVWSGSLSDAVLWSIYHKRIAASGHLVLFPVPIVSDFTFETVQAVRLYEFRGKVPNCKARPEPWEPDGESSFAPELTRLTTRQSRHLWERARALQARTNKCIDFLSGLSRRRGNVFPGVSYLDAELREELAEALDGISLARCGLCELFNTEQLHKALGDSPCRNMVGYYTGWERTIVVWQNPEQLKTILGFPRAKDFDSVSSAVGGRTEPTPIQD